MSPRTDTRQRMLDIAAELFHRQGYHATGLTQLTSASGAPKGSLYFHFPGGKEQLAAEAMTLSGRHLRGLLRDIAQDSRDPAEAVHLVVEALGTALADSGFQAGCPLATVATDAAAGSEPIRAACANGYASWQDVIAQLLVTHGVDGERATELGAVVLASIEGGLLLAKVRRDLQPLHAVGAHLRDTITKELS